MVIEVEMKGLAFNEGKLPADWENWRDLGNDVYAVQYKPSGYLNAVTMNLITAISDISEPCTITVQSAGYETETDIISATQVIPAGNLRTPSTDDLRYSTWYIYTTNPGNNTNVTPLVSIDQISRTGTSGNRTYYNTNDVQISGVSPDDTLYIRYSISYNQYYTIYYVASFKLSDAVNGQVTLNFEMVWN